MEKVDVFKYLIYRDPVVPLLIKGRCCQQQKKYPSSYQSNYMKTDKHPYTYSIILSERKQFKMFIQWNFCQNCPFVYLTGRNFRIQQFYSLHQPRISLHGKEFSLSVAMGLIGFSVFRNAMVNKSFHCFLPHLVSTYVVCERLSVMHELAGVVENLVQNSVLHSQNRPPPPRKLKFRQILAVVDFSVLTCWQ